MKRAEKHRYLEDYDSDRRSGEPYFPRYALRDAFVGLALLLGLMAISAWVGAPLDERADPLATDYVPRPEWYFFFVFQLLKYFSGDLEVIGIVVIPGLAVVFLILLPFLDRSRFRHYRRRPVVTGLTVLLLSGSLGLTLIAVAEAPAPADASALSFDTELGGGEELFGTYCAACHGELGEGAPNPAQPGDVIAPISTAEYLGSRADESIRVIVSEGLPEFGMAAFEITSGGPLQTDEVDAVVAYIRSWEADPPVELDASVSSAALSDNPEFLFPQLCAQCHGALGEGGVGPAFADPLLQQERTDQQLFDSINLGHEATAMIAWGEVLTQTQIQALVGHIRGFGDATDVGGIGAPRYTIDVLPIFEVRCVACHGTAGGWDASTWFSAVGSGDNAPVVIPGDAENSILAQMMLGTHPEGILMPPDGKLPDALVQLVVDWIEGGALE
ncbi:MAG: c-type cytochrome [Actinomycetota bacterium]|nr:c-type cytochrome [Actinomycetota bacterium]